jgi:DNA polymerase III epsilon subunit family exonuclease
MPEIFDPMGFIDDQIFVAVDLETSGINPYENEIIEVGAVRFSVEGVSAEYSSLVRPTRKLDPASSKIHKLTSEELQEDGKDLTDALREFKEFLGSDSLVFHNAPFDLSFLKVGLESAQYPMLTNQYIDHLYLSRQYLKSRKSHSLEKIKVELELEIGSHRARDDAFITAKSMMFLLNEYADRLNSAKKFRSFLRYIRRCDEFEIKLPTNFSHIQKFVNDSQRSGTVIKFIHNERGRRVSVPAKVEQLLVFNQNVFFKLDPVGKGGDSLIAISELSYMDAELGEVAVIEIGKPH